MTKIDIAARVAKETTLSKNKAVQTLNAILMTIKENLGSGEPVVLRPFGSFRVRQKRERMGRNPKTGERAHIPARKVVTFKSGKRLREAVNPRS